jgi:hypothetical protein
MIFTFWSGENQPTDAISDWSQRSDDVRLFSDVEAEACIRGLVGDDAAKLYKRINIPACKSDVARLALLYEHGGLYVDAHTGTADPWALVQVFERLSRFELIIFDHSEKWDESSRIHIINTCLAARRESQLVRRFLVAAIENLHRQAQVQDLGSVDRGYNIAELTGSGVILKNAFVYQSESWTLKPEFEKLISLYVIWPEYRKLPFHLYKHYRYRRPGSHWSERQLSENLFTDN